MLISNHKGVSDTPTTDFHMKNLYTALKYFIMQSTYIFVISMITWIKCLQVWNHILHSINTLRSDRYTKK